jgi:subtilisin-like proprotein convertase family protein
MLVLPDGKIMYSHMGTDVYVYTPAGAPLAAGKPVITTITPNGDGSFHLVGTGLNGISEGASYGDDAQMNTNYPIVRLVSTGGSVYYAKTYNWSSTGVMTGSTPVTTEFRPPASMPLGAYSLYVVANGIASNPTPFSTAGVALAGTGANTLSDLSGNGNANGRIDPGESSIALTVPIQNSGSVAATGVSATLVSNTATVAIINPTSAYANLASGGGSASNPAAYILDVSNAHPCGDPISLTLNITSAQGNGVYTFSLPTGLPGGGGSPVTTSYTGPAVTIPDNNPAGGTASLAVSGMSGSIGHVTFRFDGTACSNVLGATTVGLTHSYLGDIEITLQSPSGTVVPLMSHPTNGAGNAPTNNLCNTIFDDAGTTSIQTIGTTGDPYSGTWSPASPLAAFNGESPNGTWLVKVVDNVATDAGFIRAFSLVITASQPPTCDAPQNACPADLANGSGVGTPDGSVDINDLLFFLAAFEAGSSNADIANGVGAGTPDGAVDINDLLFFLQHFELGC